MKRIFFFIVVLGTSVACSSDPIDTDRDGAVADGSLVGEDASIVDGEIPDGSVPDATVTPPPKLGDVVYEPGLIQSPVDPSVIERWRSITGSKTTTQSNVFAKVGDSITAAEAVFMGCFVSQDRSLGDYTELGQTIDYFEAGDAAGTDPFTRDSVTAIGGWTAQRAISGDPSPLEREVEAINPQFALVMYGTNDSGFPDSYLFEYADYMWSILDLLSNEGVLPILSTIPPRTDSATAGARIPYYNAIIRGFAQTRGLPLVDYFASMVPLATQGLAGDGVHPNAGGASPCDLAGEALVKGYNTRNLVMLEALDRVRRGLLVGESFAEPTTRSIVAGRGSSAEPYEIAGVPFAHAGTTSGQQSALDIYDGCEGDQNEAGPEVIYKLEVDREMDVSIFVADPGDVDIDIHLLRGSVETASCEARAHQRIDHTLDPGTWYVVADSFVSDGGEERAGQYLLVITDS